MLTATQKRLHQQAFTLLTDYEMLLSIIQEFTTIKEEVKQDPARAAYYQKKIEANHAKKDAKLAEYFDLLKNITEPFLKDMHEGEEPQPQVPKISVVQLAEMFHNLNNEQPCNY